LEKRSAPGDGLSLASMVSVAAFGLPSEAPEGFDSARLMVSLPSAAASLRMVTVKLLAAPSPLPQLSVPEAAA
jgi:hypothetical protein